MNPLTKVSEVSLKFTNQSLNTPIPSDDERKVKQIAENIFGSINPDKPLYDVNAFLGDVLSKRVNDYIVVGVAEQGIENRSFCYYAVKGPLALFVQLKWSLEDTGRQRGRITNTLAAIKVIFEDLDKVREKVPQNKRLLVVLSDFRGSGCQWITGQPGKIDENNWKAERPLLQALNALELVGK